MTLDDELRELLHREPPVPPDYVARVMAALPESRRRADVRLPLVVLVAFAVVVLGGYALLAGGPIATPSASPSGPRTAAPPSPTPGPSLGAWTQVTFTMPPTNAFLVPGSLQIAAGTVWPGGFLFIGTDGAAATSSGFAWTSSDGLTWTRSRVPAFDGRDLHPGVVWTGQRLVAVGAVVPPSGATGLPTPSGFAWTSTDGLTWTPAPDTAVLASMVPTSVAAGPSGIVVSGNSVGKDGRVALAWSADGLVWTLADTSSAMFDRVAARSVVATAAGFLLAGTYLPRPQPDAFIPRGPAALFRSGDGIRWQPGAAPEQSVEISLLAAGETVLAAGSTCGGCIGQELWVSRDDGQTWRLVPQDPSELWVGTFTTTTGRFLWLGQHGQSLRWSDDGAVWHVLRPSKPLLADSFFFDFLVDGDRAVLVSAGGAVIVGQLH